MVCVCVCARECCIYLSSRHSGHRCDSSAVVLNWDNPCAASTYPHSHLFSIFFIHVLHAHTHLVVFSISLLASFAHSSCFPFISDSMFVIHDSLIQFISYFIEIVTRDRLQCIEKNSHATHTTHKCKPNPLDKNSLWCIQFFIRSLFFCCDKWMLLYRIQFLLFQFIFIQSVLNVHGTWKKPATKFTLKRERKNGGEKVIW